MASPNSAPEWMLGDHYVMVAATTKDWFQPILWHCFDLPLRELSPDEIWKWIDEALEELEEPANFTGWTFCVGKHRYNPEAGGFQGGGTWPPSPELSPRDGRRKRS